MSDNQKFGPGPTDYFLPLLAIVFITLKLMGYITWSWLWVLAPLWIPFTMVFITLVVVWAIVNCR